MLATIGWAVLLVFVVAVPGYHSRFGTLKWTDFVHFYTLGDAAVHAAPTLLYDADALHERQEQLVPASAADRYLPVYAPQTALIFAPFARIPYLAAGAVWAGVIVGTYLWAVHLAWRRSRQHLPDFGTVALLALASPPLVQLVGHGQTTPVVVLAFAGGWRACESGSPLMAGLALSLLAIKPQFGLVLAAVAVLSWQRALIAGVLLGVLIQVAATSAVFGGDVWVDYLSMLRGLSAQTAMLEPAPSKMHSLAAVSKLLPEVVGQTAWLFASVCLIVATATVWRRHASWRLRFGTLVLASALVNPHLSIYDVTVLALPVVWIGGWLAERRIEARRYWQLVYWLVVSVLLPTAALIRLQLSPLLMLALFLEARRAARMTAAQPPALPQVEA